MLGSSAVTSSSSVPKRRGEGQERGVSTFTVTGSRLRRPHYEETRNKLNTELLLSAEDKQGSLSSSRIAIQNHLDGSASASSTHHAFPTLTLSHQCTLMWHVKLGLVQLLLVNVFLLNFLGLFLLAFVSFLLIRAHIPVSGFSSSLDSFLLAFLLLHLVITDLSHTPSPAVEEGTRKSAQAQV